MELHTKINGVNPPPPGYRAGADSNVSQGSTSTEKSAGQRLIGLIRSLEKRESNTGYQSNLNETEELLNYLIEQNCRRGLLQGNIAKAEGILSLQKTNTREKRSKKDQVGTDLKIHQGDLSNDNPDSADLQDESLLFTSVIRILNGVQERSNKSCWDDDDAIMVCLAAEWCISVGQNLNTAKSSDLCSHAEHLLLLQYGKSILLGLISAMKVIEDDIHGQNQTKPFNSKCGFSTLEFLEEGIHIDPMISCVKAASCLVSLFGTNLSRSTSILNGLYEVGWRILILPNDRIQFAASKLLACIPLAGGTDRKTPSDLWNLAIDDISSTMLVVVDKFAPIDGKKKVHRKEMSEKAHQRMEAWLEFTRKELSVFSDRANFLYRLLNGLTKCIIALLSQDRKGENSKSALIAAKVDIDCMLNIIERFLSFPIAAETILSKTKKRLRNEAVDDGLLSPTIIARGIANPIKGFGHELILGLVSSIGGDRLLPYARRFYRMTYASLLTSCSTTVRKVVDPTGALQLGGDKKRWLHISVPSRCIAISSVKLVLTTFGCDRSGKSSNRVGTSPSDGELTAKLVAACLIEEISKEVTSDSPGESWGSYDESISLIKNCAQCLQAMVASCGPYMTSSTRSLIDSTTVNALLEMRRTPQIGIFSWSNIKIAFLSLAASCVTTPWSDGSASSITKLLIEVASKQASDSDETVVLTAKSVLRLCDRVSVPRAPALVFVSRSTQPANNASPEILQSASGMMKDMKKAREEAREALNAAEKQAASNKKRSIEKKEKAEKGNSEEEKKKRLKSESLDRKLQNEAITSTQQESKEIKMGTEKGEDKNIPRDESVDGGESSGRTAPPPFAKTSTEIGKDQLATAKDDDSNQKSNGNAFAANFEKISSKQPPVEPESEDDEDFPDIVMGGPDSDDE